MSNVHVGVQLGRIPAELIVADANEARWELDLDVVERDGEFDFRVAPLRARYSLERNRCSASGNV